MMTKSTEILTLFFVGMQDPYNLERVFWLMLGRNGAEVKTMMENFQNQHKHPLPEEHRRMVLMVDYGCQLYNVQHSYWKYMLCFLELCSYRRFSQLEQ